MNCDQRIRFTLHEPDLDVDRLTELAEKHLDGLGPVVATANGSTVLMIAVDEVTPLAAIARNDVRARFAALWARLNLDPDAMVRVEAVREDIEDAELDRVA